MIGNPNGPQKEVQRGQILTENHLSFARLLFAEPICLSVTTANGGSTRPRKAISWQWREGVQSVRRRVQMGI